VTLEEPDPLLGQVLLWQAEVPLEEEVLPFRIPDHPLTIASELRVVGGQQHQPSERSLPEVFDDVAVAEIGVDPPMGGDGTEIDDAHMATGRLWLLVG
jgi:hypothetical protein